MGSERMGVSPGIMELSVKHDVGPRFLIRVRDHEVVVDQPLAAGGGDTGPTPTELFVGSIASCAAFYGRTYLAKRGFPEKVDVVASWEVAPRPVRVARVALEVIAPGVPYERREAFRRVIEGCLVHNSLRRGCEVDISLRYEASDAAAG